MDGDERPLQEYNYEKMLLRLPAFVLIVAMICVGIVGNGLMVYIYGFQIPMNTNNSLIMIMAACDVLIAMLIMPSFLVWEMLPTVFPSPELCKVMNYAFYSSTGISASVLLLIAANRYRMACRPFGAQLSVRTARILSVTAAGVYFVYMIPIYLAYDCVVVPVADFSINATLCDIDKEYLKTIQVHFSIFFIIMLCIIAGIMACYLLIWIQVKQRGLLRKGAMVELQQQQAAGGEPGGRLTPAVSLNDGPPVSVMSHLTVTMLLVVIVFIFSYLPTSILIMTDLFSNLAQSVTPVGEAFYSIVRSLYFLCNTLNPFIYGYRQEECRKELKKLLPFRRTAV